MDKEIKEWLSKYKRLPSNELQEFASWSSSNDKLITSLFNLFEILPGDIEHIEPVCHQLYDFYRSKDIQLQAFALQFVPVLIWLYLTGLTRGSREVCGSVETFLLGVYNLEIVQADGTPVVETFRIPAMGRPSVYHDPRGSGMASEALTESALRILNRAHDEWKGGPHPQCEHFNTQNRFSILAVVMQHYNRMIDSFHNNSLLKLCQAANNIVSSGFGNVKQLRVPVHSSLLIELLSGVYFALHNGHQSVGAQAVRAVHMRAKYELYSDVLLMTNSLLNLFQCGDLPKAGYDKEALLTPSGSKKALHKKMSITNASFKTKKLPDDIEFTEEDINRLSTVEEDGGEQEHSMAKNLKAKLMNIGGKLGVDRNKHRQGDGSSSSGSTPARRDSDALSSSDIVDSVGVAVVGGRGSGNTSYSNSGKNSVVDVLEMQPIRNKKEKDNRGYTSRISQEAGIDQLENEVLMKESAGANSNNNLSMTKSPKPSSTLVFSKKLGFSKSNSPSPSNTTHSSPSGSSSVLSENKRGKGFPATNLFASEMRQNSPSLPLIISDNHENVDNFNGDSKNSHLSSSREGSGSKKDKNVEKRAHSEGRNLESSLSNNRNSGGSISNSNRNSGHFNENIDSKQQSKILNSISDSNLSPANVMSSSSPTATVNTATTGSGSQSARSSMSRKTSGTSVNRNSYSTDL